MERYLWVLGGVALTGIVMTGNVMGALAATQPESLSRVIYVTLCCSFDILVIASMRSLTQSLASGHMLKVFLAAGAWAFMASCTCYSCAEFFRDSFSRGDSPRLEAKVNMQEIDGNLSREREHLGAAEQAVLTASSQMKRDNAKAEADATRKRISDLEAKRQWPAQVVAAGTVDQLMRGRELPVTVALFLLSQVCWFFGLEPNQTTGQPMVEDHRPPVLKTILRPEKPFKTKENHRKPDHQMGYIRSLRTSSDSVAGLLRDGLSERAVATELGIPRSQVQKVKRGLKVTDIE